MIEYFWAFGTMLVNGLAWATLDSLGWRYLVGLSTIPVVLGLGAFVWLPESPHWLLTVGRGDEALDVLRHCALLNGKADAFPPGTTLVSHAPTDATSSISFSPAVLFSPGLRRTTFLCWVIWPFAYFAYYGTLLILPEVLELHNSSALEVSAHCRYR